MKPRALALLVWASLVILFILLLVPKLLHLGALQTRSRDLEAEISRLRRQNQLLEHELKLLREDPVYLERVARQKLNKAKEGEIVYKVVRE